MKRLILATLCLAALAGCGDSPAPSTGPGPVNNADVDAGDDGRDGGGDETDTGDETDAGDEADAIEDVEDDADEADAVEDVVDDVEDETDGGDDPDPEPDPAVQETLSETPIEGEGFEAGIASTNAVHLAMGADGCALVDTSDPTQIATTGTVDTPGTAEDIAVDEASQTDYVADGDAGLTLVSWSDPANLEVVSTLDEHTPINAVAVDPAARQLHAGSGGQLVTYDLANPREPEVIGVRDLNTETEGVTVLRIVRHTRVIFVLLSDGEIFALQAGAEEPVWTETVEGAADLAVVRDVLVVVLAEGGQVAYDVSDPANAAEFELETTNDPTVATAASGNGDLMAFSGPGEGVWCYGAQGDDVGLVAIPVEDVETPQGIVAVTGGVLAVYPDRAEYVNTPPFATDVGPADGAEEVPVDVDPVVTFSEPLNPETISDTSAVIVPVGEFVPVQAAAELVNPTQLRISPETPMATNKVHELTVLPDAEDEFGASLTPTNGFRATFTTGDGAGPEDELGEDELDGTPQNGVTIDDVAYFCMESGDLQVTNVADPENPTNISTLELDGACQELVHDERRDLIFVAAADAGVIVINVETPDSPEIVTTFELPGAPGDAASCAYDAARKWLYVGAGSVVITLDVFDLDAIRVVRVGEALAPAQILQVRIWQDFLVVLMSDGSVRTIGRFVLNVVEGGVYFGPANPRGFVLLGNLVHLACQGVGIVVIELGGDGTARFVEVADPRPDIVRIVRRNDTVVAVYLNGAIVVHGYVFRPERGWHRVRIAGYNGLPSLRTATITESGFVIVAYTGGYRIINISPFVVSTEPAAGFVDARPDIPVRVIFSEPVSVGTAVRLESGGEQVAVTIEGDDTRTPRCRVDGDLNPNTDYTLIVGGDITDRRGLVLHDARPVEVDFTTGDALGDAAARRDDLDEGTRATVVVGDHGYACGDSGRLQIMAVAEPTTPRVIDTVELPGVCTDISVDFEEENLVIGFGYNGVAIYTLVNPELPGLVVRYFDFDEPFEPIRGAVFGPEGESNLVYVALGARIIVLDFTDIQNVIVVRIIEEALGAPIFRIRVAGPHLVVVLIDGTVVTLVRETLVVVSVVDFGDDPIGLEILDRQIYICYRGGAIQVIDIAVDGTLGVAVVFEGGREGVVRFAVRDGVLVVVYGDGVAECYGIVVRGGVRTVTLLRVLSGFQGIRTVIVYRGGYVLIIYRGGYSLIDPPPFVLGTSPVDGEADVPTNAALRVIFSEPVVVEEGDLTLEEDGALVQGTPQAELGGLSYVLALEGDMKPLTPHTLTVSAAITDAGGQPLVPDEDLTVNFTTNNGLDDGTREIVVVGDFGYACGESGRLQVMDLSDPDNPTIVNSVTIDGVCEDVAADEDGQVIYIALGGGGLGIYSIVEPGSPVLVRVHVFDGLVGPCTSVVIDPDDRTIIYVSVGGVIVVLDVSNPDVIVEVRRLLQPFGVNIYRVRIQGPYLVVVLIDGTVCTIDRETLVVISVVDFGDDPFSVVIIDGRVYVGYRGAPVCVIPIGPDGTIGEQVPFVTDRTDVVRITARGDTLVVVYEDGTVEVYGFVIRGGVRVLILINVYQDFPGVRVVVIHRRTRVVIVYRGGYEVLNTAPFIVSTSPLDGQQEVSTEAQPQVVFSEPVQVEEGDIVLLSGAGEVPGALSTDGVTTTFVPTNPLRGNTDYTLRISPEITDDGGLGLAPDEVREVNFTTGAAEAPVVGTFPAPTNPEDIVVVGDYGYLAAGEDGVIVLDLRDPPTPEQVNVITTPGPAVQIVHDPARGWIYVACGGAGVVVIDISDPVNIVIINTLPLPDDAICTHIALQGDALYCVGGSRVFIIRVGVRNTLTIVNVFVYDVNVIEVVISGGRCYTVLVDGTVIIYDIRVDPFNPTEIGRWSVVLGDGDIFRGIAVGDGDIVYVAISGRDVVIYDVSDPGQVIVVGVIEGTRDARRIRYTNGVFVGVFGNLICVYGGGNPRNPALITTNVARTARVVIAFYRGYLICIDGDTGHILNVPPFVTFARPRAGDVNVGTGSPVTVVFSEPVVMADGELSLNLDGVPVDAQPYVEAGGVVHGLIPTVLAGDATYNVTLGFDVFDNDGLALARGLDYTFRTSPNLTGPNVGALSDDALFCGRELVITGEGFGQVPDDVSVQIAGVTAELLTHSPTELRVRVPAGAAGRTGRCVVVTSQGASISDQTVTIAGRPVLSDVSPNPAGVGQTVTCTGENFDAEDAANTRVFLGGVEIEALEVTETTITFAMPINGFSGNLVVAVGDAFSNAIELVTNIPQEPDSWFQLDTAPDANRRATHTTVYRPVTNELIIFGGAQGTLRSPQTVGDLYAFDLDTFTWRDIPDPGVQPTPRAFLHTIYVPDQDRMVVYGGNDVQNTVFSDVWSYNFTDNVWTLESNDLTTPGFRQAGTFRYFPDRRQGVLFGGFDNFGFPRHETFLYDVDTQQWTRLETSGAIADQCDDEVGRAEAVCQRIIDDGIAPNISDMGTCRLSLDFDNNCAFWTANDYFGSIAECQEVAQVDCSMLRGAHFAEIVGDEMYVFGGQNTPAPSPSSVLSDLMVLNLTTGEWRQVQADGDAPSARAGVAGTYDPVGDRIVIYGGTQGALPFLDVKALEIGGTTWVDVTPNQGQIPLPRGYHTANHIEDGNLMLIYGGIIDSTNIFVPEPYRDIWIGVLE